MSSHDRLSRNLLANLASFSLNVLVGIFFTPYLIHHLGVAAYGVIPLATTVCSYLTVLTLVINASVGRFITISLEQNNYDEANGYFNTSLFASFILVLLLLAPCTWVIFNPEQLFRLPTGYEGETSLLLTFTVGMVLLSVISSPFEVSSFCKNRFDVRNIITIVSTLIRVGLVILLFAFITPRISHVGLGIFLAAVFSLAASIYAWKRLTPNLNIQYRSFGLHCLKQLTASGGWLVISQIGTLLLLSIDLLVVNQLFGPDPGGRYASLLQWSILLRSLALTVAGVLSPTIIYFYARKDIPGMVAYTRNAVKFLGLFIALPVGLISGLARPILHIWLGPDFVPLAPLLTLMTAPLCINLGYIPLHNISTATNNVKVPGLVQVIAGVINLGLALLLAGPMGWGMYGVAAAGVIVLTMRNVIFTPLYGAHIIGEKPATFMKELLPISAVTTVLTLICWLFSMWIDLTSWYRLVIFGIAATSIYAITIWHLLISTDEKKTILSKIPGLASVT